MLSFPRWKNKFIFVDLILFLTDPYTIIAACATLASVGWVANHAWLNMVTVHLEYSQIYRSLLPFQP